MPLNKKRIALISTYVPNKCGIATYTENLIRQIHLINDKFEISVFQILNKENENLENGIKTCIIKEDVDSYIKTAAYISGGHYDLVFVQHEYGIFGGPAGSYLLHLLRGIKNTPIIITLHTVLFNPDPIQRLIFKEFDKFVNRFIVLSKVGQKFLHNIYEIDERKIVFIPHGIPDFSIISKKKARKIVSVDSNFIIVTFGLLSPNKKIEEMIKILPSIICRYSQVHFYIIGETHPELKKRQGETYRNSLIELVRDYNIERNVTFINNYLKEDDLLNWLKAADIYVGLNSGIEQIGSGTISYALGSGTPIICSRTWFTEEFLSNENGIIVSNGKSNELNNALLELIENEEKRKVITQNALNESSRMQWKDIAASHIKLINTIIGMDSNEDDTFKYLPYKEMKGSKYVKINLNHFYNLIDDFGILQHSIFSVPNYFEGYSTDDVARALIASVHLGKQQVISQLEASKLSRKFLSFLWFAFNDENGRIRNFLSIERKWLETYGSECSHGRTIWALGVFISESSNYKFIQVAKSLFFKTIKELENFQDLRTCSFAILGMHEYLKSFHNDRVIINLLSVLCEKLMDGLHKNSTTEWPWFESSLTYLNGKLPHALLVGGEIIGNKAMVDAAINSLQWLSELQINNFQLFSPIGNNGFYPCDGDRAYFDQQPIEAYTMISAQRAAFQSTNGEEWYKYANAAFNWFYGFNELGLPLYDDETGGCYDGLLKHGLNQNQGAESLICYLLSCIEMKEFSQLNCSEKVIDNDYSFETNTKSKRYGIPE